MDKMIVAVFSDETKAYEGIRALAELQDEGIIAVYATAVITKDTAGKVTMKQAADHGPIGTAVGLLSGSLIGMIRRPRRRRCRGLRWHAWGRNLRPDGIRRRSGLLGRSRAEVGTGQGGGHRRN